MVAISKITNPQKIIAEIRYVLRHKSVQQTIVNILAQAVAIGVGLATITVIVRTLGAENYGKLGLIKTIISTLSIFAGLGFTQAYSRLLLINDTPKEQKELIGTGILIFCIQTIILFCITLISLPLVTWYYHDPTLASLLFKVNFITSFTVFNLFFLITSRNMNHMYWQAANTILNPLLYLAVTLVMVQTIDPGIIDFLFAGSVALIIPIIIYFLFNKPTFSHISTWWANIRAERKRFGFHIYITQIFERITFNLDSLMLGKYSYHSVAFYHLGTKLVQPISLVSTKFTDAYLKNFNTKNKIPTRIIIYNMLWWVLATVGLLLLAKPVILWLWGPDYLHITSFLFLMSCSLLFSNIYNVLFMFLYNKGVGKEQKKHFIIRGGVNLIGNMLLIPLWGISGAVLATLLSNISFTLGMLYEYKKITRSL